MIPPPRSGLPWPWQSRRALSSGARCWCSHAFLKPKTSSPRSHQSPFLSVLDSFGLLSVSCFSAQIVCTGCAVLCVCVRARPCCSPRETFLFRLSP